jgi:hypothetical protein
MERGVSPIKAKCDKFMATKAAISPGLNSFMVAHLKKFSAPGTVPVILVLISANGRCPDAPATEREGTFRALNISISVRIHLPDQSGLTWEGM